MKPMTREEVLELGWLLLKLDRYPKHLDECDKQTIVSMVDLIDNLRTKMEAKS